MPGFRCALVIVALALAVSACGRKGPLEPPPGAAAVPTAPRTTDDPRPSASLQRPAQSGVANQDPLLKDVPRPNRPFLLDPLL